MLTIFAIGAVIGIASEVVSDSELTGTPDYIYQQPDSDFVYSEGNVGDIVFNADHVQLDVEYGSGPDVTFTVISDKIVDFSVTAAEGNEENVLTANYISDQFHDDNDYYQESVILTLPKDFDGQLRLVGDNSDINCSSAVSGSNIDFSCSNGCIYLYKVSASDINLNSDNGTISAETVTADSLTAHTDNGSMYLREVTVDGASDISTGNGHMDLEDMHFGGETVINGNGDIDGEYVKFAGDSSVTCANSEIIFTNTEFCNMTVSCGNGNVFIETPCRRADYIIDASTSNGDCNIDNGGNGQYKLDIKNRNGSIDVEFGIED